MSDLLKWVIIGLGLVLLVSLLTNKEPSKKPPSKPKSPEVITKPMEKMPAETPAEPSAFTVNGEAVSQKEFDKAFEDSLAQQRQLYKQFGQDFDKMLQGAEGAYMKLRLKGEAAENLIQKKINAQAAKKYSVSVSDTQVDDRFKKEYQRVLDFYKQRNGWTEKDIEEKLKEQKSSLDEFKKQIRAFGVDTLKQEALKAAVSGEIELNDVEVLAFIEKDPSRYAQEIIKPFNPIDAELKAFWGKHPDQFGQSRVHVRHILIRVAQDASEEAVKAAQAKIAEIQKKLSDGADFGELAKAYSEDPGTKNRGGDLGLVDEKTPFIKEFKDVALKLQAGQLSEPVRTRFGFHLIKADAREDLTLEQLRPQLKEAFQAAKQTELVNDWITRAKAGKTGRELIHARFILVAQTESQKLGELLKNGEDFDKLVKAYSKDGATVDEGGDLGWFGAGRFGPEFDDAVSKLEIGHVSGVFATPLGDWVVKLETRESEKTFEQVRDLVKEDFLSKEREDRFKKWYDKTRAQAQISFQDPLLTAYSLEHDNKLEDALASYQKLLDAKTLKDPYVAYYIARIYQNKITQAQKQHKDLEKQSDKKTELEALDKQIADYKINALKYLVETLQRASGDGSLYDAILQLDNTNALVHYKYSLWLYSQGKMNEALTHVKRAVEIDPNYTDALVLYGDLLRTDKNFSSAAEYYEKALALLPESAELQRKLAESYAGTGSWDKAKELYTKVLEKNPKDAMLSVALGDVAFASGDFEGAEKNLSQAIAIDPQVPYQLKLANVYLTSNKLDKAQELYEAILKTSPDEAEAYLGLGETQELKGDKDAALKTYRQGYDKPTATGLREELGEKILALDPSNLEIHLQLAKVYLDRKLYDQAVIHYQAILDHNPTPAQKSDALLGIADSRLGQSDYAMAKEALKAALAATEDQKAQVDVYEKLVDVERSIAGEGKPLSEEGLDALLNLAKLYKALNQTDDAKETLQTIQSENPNYHTDEVKALLDELEKPKMPEMSNLGSDGKPGQPVEIQEAKHIEAGESHPAYNSLPPTSGWHQAIAASWGVYEEPIPDEVQVHNLEHGGIMVQYRPNITEAQKKDLTELINQIRTEASACKVILAPYPKLDHAFALTAWGRIDKFDELDAGRVVQFILTWIDQGPEKVPCS